MWDKEKRAAYNKAWSEKNRERKTEYQRDYHSKRYQANMAKLVAIKAERGCERCGEKDPVVLHFHHRDPEQRSGQVASFCGFAWKKLMIEVEKCMVLCANCHAIEHYDERQLPLEQRKRERTKRKRAQADDKTGKVGDME